MKKSMFKYLIVLLTLYVSYRTIIYVMVPFYDLDDYVVMIFSSTESIAMFIGLTGIM